MRYRVVEDMANEIRTEVNRHELIITPEAIAMALKCHHEMPDDIIDHRGQLRFTSFPADVTHNMMIQLMCAGRVAKGKRTSTTKSRLPKRMWMIDTTLYANVHLLGHKTGRRGDFLRAVYAFHFDHWVSLPHIIFGQLVHFWFANEPDYLVLSYVLPYPNLTSRLLELQGYQIQQNEPFTMKSTNFGMSLWNNVCFHMLKKYMDALDDARVVPPSNADKEEEDDEEEEEDEADAEGGDDKAVADDAAEDPPATEEIQGVTREDFMELNVEVAHLRTELATSQAEHLIT